MPVQLETRNREAFELVTEALEFIDQYRESRDVARLKEASRQLRLATEKDPDYFRAQYYDAIVDDLSGQFKVAAQKLKKLLNQSPPNAGEVRYNLGLAEYHGYSHEALERAIKEFKCVLESAKDKSLRLRAQAGLAQAYAMHMIPKEHDKPNLEQIKRYRGLASTSVSEVFKGLKVRGWLPFRKSSVDARTAAEIRWTAHNAMGMALMYYADYLPPKNALSKLTRALPWIKRLQNHLHRKRQAAMAKDALSELTRAEEIQAWDWANRCDLASANMRLAYFKKDENKDESARFDNALKILQDVIERLRPGYAFAIYEKGRVLRLKGEHDKAIECFNAVLDVPAERRDVSDRRVETELKRANSGDGKFP